MNFVKCQCLYGEANLLQGSPTVRVYENAILDHWAVYDHARRLIPDSGFYRGIPGFAELNGGSVTRYSSVRLHDSMQDDDYFWLGPFHMHFGHFLISTLTRAWAIAGHMQATTKIAYVGQASPAELFQLEFVRDCLGALGITEDKLVRVRGPMRFPRLTIAGQSFTENYSAYPIYFDTLKKITAQLLPGSEGTRNTSERPIYISKAKVVSGVRTIVNESEMTEHLSREGVEIAFPDTLSFRDQLAFWSRHKSLFGFSSSAFHMAAFFGNKRLCTIAGDAHAWSNQVVLDLVSSNQNLHVHTPRGLVVLGKTEEFSESMRIEDPATMALDILRLMETFGRGRDVGPQILAPEPRSVCQTSFVNEPFGKNLARIGNASQSSTYLIDEGHSRAASGAISGRLTGYYQCHTELEKDPWWQVELAEMSVINEVRVFNRCDVAEAQSRLTNLTLLLSRDGSVWQTVDERTGTQVLGGLQGEPYRWLAPNRLVAKFVRLQIMQGTFLHMDQVEVFGEPDEAIWSEPTAFVVQ